ncbi:TerC family protein [Paenibacillus sp.]|uniref:TerC family protein n=1 Tax=Paenibacillus sp. TaxID=58172 RepID=UPI002D6F05DA|nr:TerC family protein [Paenibacillus sp.]HZG55883.1 TerC family protein [Paenibacillus sp.]
MDIMSPEFWVALGTIIFIDLILAGDNAIVIGMAARKLAPEQQKKAIFWGTFGAVAIRIVATVLVVELLKIPGLQLVGGLLLVWIAYKLLVNDDDHKDIQAKDSLWAAVRTIVIADAAMGIDNVIAVAGAAHGDFVLVVIGLLVSVPIVVWGSTLFIKLVTKFPPIIYIGSGVLAYTAAKMITHEPFIHGWFAHPAVYWAFLVLVVAGVLAGGKLRNAKAAPKLEHTSESA